MILAGQSSSPKVQHATVAMDTIALDDRCSRSGWAHWSGKEAGNIEPDEVKRNCKYYGEATAEKIKGLLEES